MAANVESNAGVSVQDRVLRLERALATAVTQERFSDAAALRDLLAAARESDPLLSTRDALAAAVLREDFSTAATLRDEVAALTERLARGDSGRVVDRLLILRGRADPAEALRVATVSRAGAVPLGLVPPHATDSDAMPRVFLQPTFSPSADYVAFTEVAFRVETVHGMRAVSIADSLCRVVVMNCFDGAVVRAVPVPKPPFFYSWSPCGKTLSMLSNDPTSPTPKVALSSIQVVAPAGGATSDLDVMLGPLASAHPLLYDFCPRDSTRVVAHLGNLNTVCVIPVEANGRKRNLTTQAGSFGTPQWHPQVGGDGREVVLFVEVEAPPSKKDDDVENSLSSSGLPEGIKGMRSIFSPVVPSSSDLDDENDDETKTDDKDSNTLDSLLGSGGSMLEGFLRRGARRLGFREDDMDGSRPNDATSKEEAESTQEGTTDVDLTRKSSGEDELGQRIAGGLRKLLPERPPPLRGQDRWGEKKEEVEKKVMNRLVMADADDPSIRRTICRFEGIMAFKLSPDGTKLVTMVTDPTSGQDELTMITGDFSPDSVVADPRSPTSRRWRTNPTQTADIILSTPYTRVLAFFWSPNSQRLLFLSAIRGSRAGAAQWATFDVASNRVVRYQKFLLSGIYTHCLNFFDQFSGAMTPWAPDSGAFCYPGRPLTDGEKERDEAAPASPSASPLLASLLLNRDGNTESKSFSAWVQNVPDTSKEKTPPSDPKLVMDNVEYASWSPC